MSGSARIKGAIKAAALRRGILIRLLPHGRQGDSFADQAGLLTGTEVRRVLDVGAYYGETAIAYRKLFPDAEIHCFEPVPDSFSRLDERLSGMSGMIVNRLAVGDSREPIELLINRFPATSSRLRPASGVERIVGDHLIGVVETLTVESTTIDEYCREHGIDHVDVLKLDVQGGELAALRGATEMLAGRRIALVYVEVLMGRLYEGQPGAGELLSAVERHGYRIYGLYNFAYGADSSLYQMDAILVSPDLSIGPHD